MQELRGNFDIDERILGIMSSSRMLLSESSIELANWKQQFQEYVMSWPWCLMLQTSVCCNSMHACMKRTLYDAACLPNWCADLSLLVQMAASESTGILQSLKTASTVSGVLTCLFVATADRPSLQT